MRDAMFPGIELDVVDTMVGSSRSRVRRVRAGAATVILKEYLQAGEAWARETAALSILPPAAPAPRLIASRDAPPAVALADAGTGGSVADALLGDDPDRAGEAVVTWARTVATLHRVTAGSRDAFRRALGERAGDLPIDESPDNLREPAEMIVRHCADLGVAVPPDAFDELVALHTRLGGDGAAALSPADTCPDNNVFTAGGLVLIDFEGAEWRHIAWDVAYLTVPWPTCWCAWRVPSEVTDAAIAAYQSNARFPYAVTPAFDSDLEAARTAWAFVSASWFLPKALADDPPLVKQGPRRRAMIQHRLRLAAGSTQLPALALLARRLDRTLTARWGENPLPLAPAFRRG
nr:phosphotransferase [uncultured Actinoplanes sp.]